MNSVTSVVNFSSVTDDVTVAGFEVRCEHGPLRETELVMPYVLIIHEVQDYAIWKDVFDKAVGIRKAAGEISYQLLRYETDANIVVHFSRWTSLEKARCFFESPELIEIRRNAGVKAPEFLYLEEIEQGVL